MSTAALRAEARAWIAAHRDAAVPARGAHVPHDHTPDEHDRRWLDALRDGRWLCLSWPERYGGRALSETEVIAVNEEFARAGVERPRLGMSETLVAPAILAHGTPEQKDRLLPRILSGRDVYCQGSPSRRPARTWPGCAPAAWSRAAPSGSPATRSGPRTAASRT
ncbi:acyl-CoA dehydrogenase family protein [Actinomadura yumaensis]|uniref:acyl-CoA dehydrogenase family protein n=1 Tax=Actinomadura yumaensis TaxID=111807 RepID=UPI003614B8E6